MTLEEAKKRMPPMWVVYDHPRDYPDNVVVRTWYGEYATSELSLHGSLTEAREHIIATLGGSARLARASSDDPCIVETWI